MRARIDRVDGVLVVGEKDGWWTVQVRFPMERS
ncbi:hypothetical protein EV641_11433 [Rhodococcus sp. SMB37]|nr:hypothetical protein EV641_11433 [Rhodococcus sp. SMB37]